ncbi:MAG: hypothetical protein J1F24_00430 [Oscillospiraceae bacterium]|nr:hypothetical protein [Oscillospiraceae bacterium]
MNKNKTLKELGEEYAGYIKLNQKNIEACKEKIKKADGDELLLSELKRTLGILYEIGRELKANSEHLIKFYGDNSPNA